MKRIAIVGGGASGMVAAITAARAGAQVTILERNERLGKKILVTGNGKCNLGNRLLSEAEYFGSDKNFIKNALNRFNTDDTVAFFNGLGLLIRERNGYLYPFCEQASAVLDVLRYELQALKVEVITECKVNQIRKTNGVFLLGAGNKEYEFDKVILACGSKAAPKTGSDGSGYKLARQLGHTVNPIVPALVQLKCQEDYLKSVSGVRTDACIRVYNKNICIAEERGELQLTDFGISGIPVFQLSRIVNYILYNQNNVKIKIDLLPDYNENDFKEMCKNRSALMRSRNAEEYFTGLLNKKLILLFLKMVGIKPSMPSELITADQMEHFYDLCRNWTVTVTGSNPYENAQVCAGGIETGEVTEFMESKLVSGVYMIGELLDVDGKCGGYNLHWAWCSGVLAGKDAAKIKECERG